VNRPFVTPFWAVNRESQSGMSLFRDLLCLTKPGITFSNLLAVIAGFRLGSEGLLSWSGMLEVCLGAGWVIAGSCALNHAVDRDIDPLMERTRHRPIPRGSLSVQTAVGFGTLLLAAGLVWLYFEVNPLSAGLAGVGAVFYLVVYSMWLKRVSIWNTVVGGISGAVPPVIGWTAAAGSLDAPAIVLFFLLFLWQPPHFYALAMMRQRDYANAGIPMLPVQKGSRVTRRHIFFFVSLLLPVSLMLHAMGEVTDAYAWIAICLGSLYGWWSARGLVGPEDPGWTRKMFRYSLVYLTVLLSAMMGFAT
jgi:heme o synthase